ncbi:MAG: KH domain-containing protein, partial [Candidatus Poseidoniales archaeon]
EGAIESLPAHLMGAFLGKQNANIIKLRDATNARIIATDNGKIWFDGDVESMRNVRKLIASFKQCIHSDELQSLIDQL